MSLSLVALSALSLITSSQLQTQQQVATLVVEPSGASIIYASEGQASAAADSPSSPTAMVRSIDDDGRVTIRLQPDRQREDAGYPLLTHVGAGWLIYLPGVILPDSRLEIVKPSGWIILPRQKSRDDGFIYLGPYVDNYELVVDPHVDAETSRVVHQAASKALSYYRRILNSAPASDAPLWILSLLPPGSTQKFVADVTPNGVVNVQIAAGLSPDDLLELEFVVAHEAFHLQTQTLWDEGALSDWEREGAAEYAAIRHFQDRGLGDFARARLQQQLNACLKSLPPSGLAERDIGPARYSCGAIYAWLSDLAPEGVFEAWRAQAGHAVEPHSRTPIVASALQALRTGEGDPAKLTLLALREHGERVTELEVTSGAWALAAIAPAMFSVCNGLEGVSQEDDGTWLLHGDLGCGDTGKNATLTAIDDISARELGRATFDYVSANCKRGVTFHLEGEAGEAGVRYHCAALPPPPKPNYLLE
ncbi:hypothetical protein [Brevundimonas nasdae]|uniref:hypothetical protein n=1 Tax=Brevundimonas nasdae TaxID=172043 RepID=UPI003F692402